MSLTWRPGPLDGHPPVLQALPRPGGGWAPGVTGLWRWRVAETGETGWLMLMQPLAWSEAGTRAAALAPAGACVQAGAPAWAAGRHDPGPAAAVQVQDGTAHPVPPLPAQPTEAQIRAHARQAARWALTWLARLEAPGETVVLHTPQGQSPWLELVREAPQALAARACVAPPTHGPDRPWRHASISHGRRHTAVALALHPVGVDVHDDAAELPQHEEARALAQAFFPKPLLNACLRTEADPWSWLTCWGELEARLKREGLPLQECGLQPDPRRDHALRQGWSLHGRHDCGWPRLALSGRDELAGSDA